MPDDVIVIVSAYDEADRLPATIAALREAFPGARLVVADDASTDATAAVALAAGAEVVTAPRNLGKGGATTRAAERVLHRAWEPDPPVFVLCDGDLAASARHLPALADAVRSGGADLAVAAFERRVGGGFGLAKGFARWAIRRRCGFEAAAPISGQRALSGRALRVAVPFAPRFGMEIGMTVDVARAGLRVREVALPLEHRATGRTWRGFVHRGRQLKDFLAVYASRR
ncbi:MAG TPA: glycosyltransferase [Solirubrobacteraceae bacterium]|nr:glycosyltransferase [Solirubrobacteraceae bacterium]